MQKRLLKKRCTGILASLSLWSAIASLSLWSAVADARITMNLKNSAPPIISIRVGNPNRVNEVTFNVLTNQLGNGTPIVGSKRIRIEVEIRATAANPLTGSLTVDSVSKPLTNTSSSSIIPFSEISWESQDDDIPSGVFEEKVDQHIVSFQSSQRYRDRHTFIYANTKPIESGTYTGSVIYTWAIP